MPGAGEGLDRTQFACALRLVALAQSCHGVLPTAPSKWLEASGTPTPPPRLGPQPAGHTPRMCARRMPGVFEGSHSSLLCLSAWSNRDNVKISQHPPSCCLPAPPLSLCDRHDQIHACFYRCW